MYHWTLTTSLGALLLLACGSSPKRATEQSPPAISATSKVDSDSLFDPNRVLAVNIELPSGDWDALRTKGRDASSLANECRGPAAKIYPYYRAAITVDGVRYEDVGVRKKGFLGSLSTVRPSLKVKFDERVKGQRHMGVRRLTLNNNNQDSSMMRTCLVYKTYRDAGLPAPRCNYARVSVNGQDLGIYSHVEPIKKSFLRRNFADDSGLLYEGQLADFDRDWVANFEQKNLMPESPDRLDLERLTKAMDDADDEMLETVKELIDYDRFLSFWALETLTGHWDGFSNNQNNTYVYKNPVDGKFHFIPWGPDMGFHKVDPFHKPNRPAAVSASAKLTQRLYAHPKVRADYIARMKKLLAESWDEKALLAEVKRIDTLLGGAPDRKSIVAIEEFISSRGEKLSKELAVGGVDWNQQKSTSPCYTKGASISGSFETSFGDLEGGNPMSKGVAELKLIIDGKPIKFGMVGVGAGRDPNLESAPVIRYVGMSGTSIYVLQLMFEETLFRAEEEQPFQGFATWAMLIELENMRDFKLHGFLGKGSIKLDQVGTTEGAAVSGSFAGTLFLSPELRPSK